MIRLCFKALKTKKATTMNSKDIVLELRNLPKGLKEIVDDSTKLVESLQILGQAICRLVGGSY